MSLIDKDKTLDAISMYLFVNDAVRNDVKVGDYRVFAESILKDVPEVSFIRCGECKRQRSCVTYEGLNNKDGFCSMGEQIETSVDCSWK